MYNNNQKSGEIQSSILRGGGGGGGGGEGDPQSSPTKGFHCSTKCFGSSLLLLSVVYMAYKLGWGFVMHFPYILIQLLYTYSYIHILILTTLIQLTPLHHVSHTTDEWSSKVILIAINILSASSRKGRQRRTSCGSL